MISKVWVARLTAVALLLPAAIVVLAALGKLLHSMGDQSAGRVLDRLALVGGVSWVIVLLGLLLSVAVRHSADSPDELDQ